VVTGISCVVSGGSGLITGGPSHSYQYMWFRVAGTGIAFAVSGEAGIIMGGPSNSSRYRFVRAVGTGGSFAVSGGQVSLQAVRVIHSDIGGFGSAVSGM
jgi:hypothetical protein